MPEPDSGRARVSSQLCDLSLYAICGHSQMSCTNNDTRVWLINPFQCRHQPDIFRLPRSSSSLFPPRLPLLSIRLGFVIDVDAFPLPMDVAFCEFLIIVDGFCCLDCKLLGVVEDDQTVEFSWTRGSNGFVVREMWKHMVQPINFLFRKMQIRLLQARFLSTQGLPADK